jgi:hypothetical protein
MAVLSGGLRKKPGPLRPSPNRARLSWSCSTLQRNIRTALAPVWVGCSPLALHPDRLGSRVFTRSGAGEAPKSITGVLSWASALLQSPPSLERPPRARDLSAASRKATAPPMRFLAPTAFPRTRQQPVGRVCLSRPLASPGFLDLSTPSSASCLPAIVSGRIRSWGCTLQSLPPPVQPYAVSGARYPPDVGSVRRPSSPSGSCSARESATERKGVSPAARA